MKSREAGVALLGAVLAVGVGCGPSHTSMSQYLDGCRDKQGFLERESLVRSNGEPVRVGPVEFRPPPGSYLRSGSDSMSIIQAVYCDSGDWGINPGDHIRLKLYPHPPPADLYADLPEEVTFLLKRKSPPIGAVDHEFWTAVDFRWRAQVELLGTVIPYIRTAYFTTTVGEQALAVTFVAETGGPSHAERLERVLRSIRLTGDG